MTGIIILAAGQSSRMGTPKQQLHFRGKSLLQHAITTAAESNAEIIIVVLGCQADTLCPEKVASNVNIIINENWQEGMGGSIHVGMIKLTELHPQVQNVIIMLCDQPLTTANVLNSLIQKKVETSHRIVACSYSGTIGVPALFSSFYFAHLAAMRGEAGAKRILHQFISDVAIIDFPGGAVDIDTPEDFTKFLDSV